MFARVNVFEGVPGRINDSMADVRSQVLPACEEIEGFAAMVVLADRTSGKSIAITFWESEAALRTSEEAAAKIRTESASRQEELIVSVERFEVMLDTLGGRVA